MATTIERLTEWKSQQLAETGRTPTATAQGAFLDGHHVGYRDGTDSVIAMVEKTASETLQAKARKEKKSNAYDGD